MTDTAIAFGAEYDYMWTTMTADQLRDAYHDSLDHMTALRGIWNETIQLKRTVLVTHDTALIDEANAAEQGAFAAYTEQAKMTAAIARARKNALTADA